MLAAPINLMQWIATHEKDLVPPVCNRVIWENQEFIVMVVGGPNARDDYHVDEGEEWFYQIKGDMCLRVIDEGRARDIWIRAGETFLLPALVPHSPQRFANSVGLVLERKRKQAELDGFQWYCQDCHQLLHEEFLHVSDIVADLPPVMARFYDDENKRRCQHCGAMHPQAKR